MNTSSTGDKPASSELDIAGLMNLERLLEAGVYFHDLLVVDAQFVEKGVGGPNGFVHLKAALVALANVADFEASVRPTYKTEPGPSAVAKPLLKNLQFAKYLRNKVVGHIHPKLIAKAVEWEPMLRHAAAKLDDPKVLSFIQLRILETAINTYVNVDGSHKFFDGETDLMYPPDWNRFVAFLEETIRGCLAYLRQLNQVWAVRVASGDPAAFDLDLAIAAGKTEFKFLGQ